MLKAEAKKAIEQLKQMNNTYIEDYKAVFEKDKKEVLHRLKPGQPVPAENIVILDENKALLNQLQMELKDKAQSVLNELKSSINKAMTKAPSNEALNYIELLSKRTTLNRDDINLALNTYGENYQIDKVLVDLAKKNEIAVDDISIVEDILSEATTNLFNSYDRVLGRVKNNNSSIESDISWLNFEIDSLLGE